MAGEAKISPEKLAAFEKWEQSMASRGKYNEARRAAQGRLQNQYKDEFNQFLAQEKKRLGIT